MVNRTRLPRQSVFDLTRRIFTSAIVKNYNTPPSDPLPALLGVRIAPSCWTGFESGPYNGHAMDGSVGPLEWAAKTAFYGVAAATLLGAWYTVSARNLFRAALGLGLALFGIAGLYLYLEAEFLAVSQLLIYVGAILTLIIFGVMLTARIADPSVPRWNRQAGISFLLALGVGLGLARLFLKTPWATLVTQGAASPVSLATLGRSLVSIYLLPFELLSLLLLGALVGAILIARKEKG